MEAQTKVAISMDPVGYGDSALNCPIVAIGLV